MVSVIIPVFNVLKYIDKCMESIVNQTYKDIEIILINDGSTDGSDRKCEDWKEKDQRIIYIHKNNEGQGIARNIGVAVSRGEYIAFVDSDDWIPLSTIENMYIAAKDNEADIVTGNFVFHYYISQSNIVQKSSELRLTKNTVLNPNQDPDIINRARPYLWGRLFRRTLFVDNKITVPSCYFEDTATMPLLIALSKHIYYIDKPVYNYLRDRPNNTVNNLSSLSDIIESLQLLKQKFIDYKLFKHYEHALRKLIFSQIRFVYRQCNENKTLISSKLQNDLIEFLDREYPQFINFKNRRFYIDGDDTLVKAVGNLVFESSQICDTLNERINYYIKYNDSNKIINGDHVFIISISKPRGDTDNYETLCWNMSDEIFYKIL